MKLFFIIFAAIDSAQSHVVHLYSELAELAKHNEIYILCLCDKTSSDVSYQNVSIDFYPITFEGWNIKNLQTVSDVILGKIKTTNPDLVVLTLEIWDLMRELGQKLAGKYPFATIANAMPFLAAPITVSNNFEKDILTLIESDIPLYRKNYIKEHYKEVDTVLSYTNIIAATQTVKYYLNSYFPKMMVWAHSPILPAKISSTQKNVHKDIDFVYMARIEKGKGLEYFEDILEKIYHKLKRPVSLTIMGSIDDDFSKTALDNLIKKANQTKHFSVCFLGWADAKLKHDIFSRSRVFLYPSHYDIYAIVLVEALSYGLPAVVWDAPFAKNTFSTTTAVKQAKLLDTNEFANLAITCLDNEHVLRTRALNFISKFPTMNQKILHDINIFQEIIRRFHDKN